MLSVTCILSTHVVTPDTMARLRKPDLSDPPSQGFPIEGHLTFTSLEMNPDNV
ncbi:hypothetical protein DPMN_093487 [Dreissena polymorpha]|uniref:Uncharacterized protein n=1 Tax=Dreissena polymorpha TaxID=45954 RepID=A0A9D4R2L1_DREPO|nr:hypothetical protein DPMN_093487 [Dreissena polymorpha]